MLDIYVDADACPVKAEIFRLAARHDLKVLVVASGPLRVPERGRVEKVRVPPGLDAADDWIAERAGEDDIVVTADIPLAGRCLARGARVLAPNGQVFTEASIGDALASRGLMRHLREMGEVTGGPAPFAPSDRGRFLSRLGEAIQAIKTIRAIPNGAARRA
jgi:uncharacterized protein YaiI (UPF0178 family)